MTYALLCEGKDEREVKQLDSQLSEPRIDVSRRAARDQAAMFDWANEG